MADSKSTRGYRSLAIGVAGTALLIGLFLAAQSRAHAVHSPAGQKAQPTAGLRPDGMPANFPFHEPRPLDFSDHKGYVSLFNGRDLKGWSGDPSVWSVKEGAIVGVSTKADPKHSYLVYRGLVVKNFDLKVEAKLAGSGGSGIQYRSQIGLPWHGRGKPPVSNLDWWMTGPQLDFWSPTSPSTSVFTGQLYSENTSLGIIAWRGQVVQISRGGAPTLIASIGNRLALGRHVKVGDWNEFEVIARGGTILQIVNGKLMSALVDDNPHDANNRAGLIGIEIESAPCIVSVRGIWVRKLPS